MHNEFNESFRKVFTSALPVSWSQITTLTHTLSTRHFKPEFVVIPGGFQDIRGPSTGRLGSKPRAPLQNNGYRGTRHRQKTVKKAVQESVHNLVPIPSLQVGIMFKLWIAIDMAE